MPRRKEYKMVLEVPVWETLPGGHHEASPPCLRHFLRCSTGLHTRKDFSAAVVEASFSQETYTETRDITDSAGNTFSCLYTIVYDTSRKVFCLILPIFSGPLSYSSCKIFCPFCPDLFFARLSTGSRARSNATLTPMESRLLRTSSLR